MFHSPGTGILQLEYPAERSLRCQYAANDLVSNLVVCLLQQLVCLSVLISITDLLCGHA